jgi:2-polyprenyl-3-methyl-5-hydroxy-6-metoxy-1,4-benzoquinol methylase
MTKQPDDTGDRSNKGLQEKYENIYSQGEEEYFSKFNEGVDTSGTIETVLELADWSGKSVVDVGCGTGELLRQVAARGAAELTGIDYSKNAIQIARERGPFENTTYIAGDVFETTPAANDIVMSCGTIEHSDSPREYLDTLRRWGKDDSLMIVTCPHFINLRGFVWMALATLQNVPMSLTDLHFIHPWHMERWCGELGLEILQFTTCDYGRANGKLLLKDFDKRLHNALRDAGIDNSEVPNYLDYLSELISHIDARGGPALDGATAIYVIGNRPA